MQHRLQHFCSEDDSSSSHSTHILNLLKWQQIHQTSWESMLRWTTKTATTDGC